MTRPQREHLNRYAWALALLAAFGSWLVRVPENFEWSQTFEPHNLGALLLALTSPFIAGKFVKEGVFYSEDDSENDERET